MAFEDMGPNMTCRLCGSKWGESHDFPGICPFWYPDGRSRNCNVTGYYPPFVGNVVKEEEEEEEKLDAIDQMRDLVMADPVARASSKLCEHGNLCEQCRADDYEQVGLGCDVGLALREELSKAQEEHPAYSGETGHDDLGMDGYQAFTDDVATYPNADTDLLYPMMLLSSKVGEIHRDVGTFMRGDPKWTPGIALKYDNPALVVGGYTNYTIPPHLKIALMDNLGDTLFSVARLASAMDMRMSDVAHRSRIKLADAKKRAS